MRAICLSLLVALSFTSLVAQSNAQSNAQSSLGIPEARGHCHRGMSSVPLDLRASATRSDSFDIKHTLVELDITDFVGKTIEGSATLTVEALQDGMNALPLDLRSLVVSSVEVDGSTSSFTQTGDLLMVDLPATWNTGDEGTVQVFYAGSPATDPTWGGFYWSGAYAYNMGVAFDLAPHSFGRAWFPAFDNFVERCTFEFRIVTEDDKRAACNGELQGSTVLTDSTTEWHWLMNESLPAYLVSVAVAPYTTLEWTHSAVSGDVPVMLQGVPGDTANMRSHFVHLNKAIDRFEWGYGPHQFSRVGFTMVPFFGGAMEHATTIHYPRFAIAGGGLDFETLMAHELAHHWWGDLITCRTAEDMWLNEGWASWSERFFLEGVYGRDAYLDAIDENHLDVIHYTHTRDGGIHRAISGVPHEYTYGSTVYDKGADVVHSLRGYMGDTDFFNCISSFLSDRAFSDVSSVDLMGHLSTCSGKDMQPFFDAWVFAGGWAGFTVDSMETVQTQEGDWWVRAHLRQRTYAAPELHRQVPLEIGFRGAGWDQEIRQVMMDGPCATYETYLPFKPTWAVIDPNRLLSDATTYEEWTIDGPGSYDSEPGPGFMELEVLDPGDDSIWVRAEHHWVEPDGFRSPMNGLHISDRRFWTLKGNMDEGFVASGRLLFNGLASTSGGYLDNDLMTNSDDSVVLLYRSYSGEEWSIYPDYVLNVWGATTDGRGAFELSAVRPGDYAVGIYDASRPDLVWSPPGDCGALHTGIEEIAPERYLSLSPNPNPGFFTVRSADGSLGLWEFRDLEGRLLATGEEPSNDLRIELKDFQPGMHLLQVRDQSGSWQSLKVMLTRD